MSPPFRIATFNVAVNWAADNKIPVNADEKVYNPDAINFVNASDHIEASQKFIANAKVSLKNVKTGQMENRDIDAVATWTPGDVMAAQGRSSVNYKGTATRNYRRLFRLNNIRR